MSKPAWLHVNAGDAKANAEVSQMLRELGLNTVCEEADCPNMNECFGRKTATFMILGSRCTRNCRFCSVRKGTPDHVDQMEPARIADAVKTLGLKYVVVTSVTRDDLPDGGAGHFAAVINAVKAESAKIEVLIPDFQGDITALKTVVDARPDVLNHNIETVRRLYPGVRPMADYDQSLELLRRVKEMDPDMKTKSGMMLGLGEKEDEVLEVFRDLLDNGCSYLTIGQYLAPSSQHHPVVEYVEPAVFDKYKEKALKMGFKYVLSGPLVRSSYHADLAQEDDHKEEHPDRYEQANEIEYLYADLKELLPLKKLIDDFKVASADEYYEDFIEIMNTAYDVGKPKAVYAVKYVDSADSDTVTVEGVVLEGPLITEKLGNVHRVFPYAATCGTELAAWAEKIDDPLLRYYADMLNQKAASLMAARVLANVKQKTGIEKLSSINPGSLPSWPIVHQRELFELLDPAVNNIGISLSESCLMIPVKSVSGILFPSSEEWFNCMRCARKNCPDRRV